MYVMGWKPGMILHWRWGHHDVTSMGNDDTEHLLLTLSARVREPRSKCLNIIREDTQSYVSKLRWQCLIWKINPGFLSPKLQDKIWSGYELGYRLWGHVHNTQAATSILKHEEYSTLCPFIHFLTNTGFSLGPVSSSESEYSSYSEDWGRRKRNWFTED